MNTENNQQNLELDSNENFASLLEENLLQREFNSGSLITGVVIDIEKEYVILDIGLKSEASVSKNQFTSLDGQLNVAIGDEVEVILDMMEDGYGETRVSREKAQRNQALAELEKLYQEKSTIRAVLLNNVRAGWTAKIVGGNVESSFLKAFVPNSLLDIQGQSDEYLENREMDFKIIKLDVEKNNIVLSHRAVIAEKQQDERSKLIEKANEGDVIEGIIKNLTDYGAFIDLGGFDGLLHITDISWKRIKHPSEVLTIGETIKVQILKLDSETNRVSLGLKQLEADPWQKSCDKYHVNSIVQGKVTKITDYGCFIELEEGVEGLIHVSEMDWTNKNVNPTKVVSPGKIVNVKILEINTERRRISFSLKQCQDNPWEKFATKYKAGEKTKGKISSITDFGIFISLEGNIDGLAHISDISWENKKAEKTLYNYKKGEEIEAIILSIEASRERISLGIKQLQDDPFSKYLKEYKNGDIVKGIISSSDMKGITLELAPSVDGIIKASELSKKRTKQKIQIGNTIEAQIINADHKSRILYLSTKVFDDADAQLLKNINKNTAKAIKNTLGDILKDKTNS